MGSPGLLRVTYLSRARGHGIGGLRLLNKQIGSEIGISEITVKTHLVRVVQKMKADSLTHLVKIAAGSASHGVRGNAPPT